MYAEHWESYAARGWTPLPLPPGQKFPPPRGFTGADRKIPSKAQMRLWAENQSGANIALPLPADVIGIDVDAYHGGADTLARLKGKLGDLPLTTWSTSRDDGSGIYLFCVPEDARLVHAAPPGIEIIQYHHRYVVAPPSVHPEGRVYAWHDDDAERDGEIPYADDFPRLPDAWLAALTDTRQAGGTPFAGSVDDWMDSLPDTRMSAVFAREYNKRVRQVELLPGSRHDTMVTMVNWLVHCGAEGHNVRDALDDLLVTYDDALDGERDGEKEFYSALSWAIRNFGSTERNANA